MSRLKVGDSIVILEKYSSLYAASTGVIVSERTDPTRSMFDEFDVEFADGSRAPVLDFQLIEDVSSLPVSSAAVVIDSADHPNLSRTRGEETVRYLLLRADQLDLHLEVLRYGSTLTLLGQVLERGKSHFLPGVEVRLIRQGKPFEVETPNNIGEFRFSSLPEGPVNLDIVLRPQGHRILAEILI